MIYEVKKDNAVHFYNVTYNKEKLEEILERLKKYSYISTAEQNMAGNVTRWPATKKIYKKEFHLSFIQDTGIQIIHYYQKQ